ncbi:hypothetical protein GQF03_08005 [Sneathiella chungangensis]|uniref:Uncharacterized protein n=1 Tax=Sneathiella chungangensis TaxID=1418234 RepID=A0A845MFQ2_9PROT|nr:hypothetical protein [Sneathiella chungangensis]
MNLVVKAQLNEFRKSNPSANLEDSELFEVYSIFSVTNGILGENVNAFDLHLRGQEFGLDGVGILVQGDVCIDSDAVAEALQQGKKAVVDFLFFQAKTSEKLDYGDLSKFFDAIYYFFTDKLENVSDQIDDLLEAKASVYDAALSRNPNIKCYFVTTGQGDVSDAIQTLIDSNRARLKELNLFNTIEIDLVGAEGLQNSYRTATNSISETIEFQKVLTLPSHNSVSEGYTGYIDAAELLKLVTIESGSDTEPKINRTIFFDNIRDFDKNSSINKAIIEELNKGDAESFIFKNNGITIVA